MPANTRTKIAQATARQQRINRHYQEAMNRLDKLHKQFIRRWRPAWKAYERGRIETHKKYEEAIQKEGKK